MVFRATEGRLIGDIGYHSLVAKGGVRFMPTFGSRPMDLLSRSTTHGLTLVGGGAQSPVISLVESDSTIARDTTRPMIERLEAFEGIIDAELGDTALTRARDIERKAGFRQIYLKFEGGNPSGTHKDRVAFALVKDALRRGFLSITAATCGNYGAAVSAAANLIGLRCVIFIPANYHARRIDEMEENGAKIRRAPGDYENAVKVSQEFAVNEGAYDANPGGDNTSLQLLAYAEIAHEIYEELQDAPAVVAAPVSNGTALAGIYRGFLSLYRRGKTSRIPKMVAGSAFGKNPIVSSFVKDCKTCVDLSPDDIHETEVNEPLINWHSADGMLALEAIRKTGGWASDITDKTMMQCSRMLKDSEGLSVLPAASAGLVALLDQQKSGPLTTDRYVAVITSKR